MLLFVFDRNFAQIGKIGNYSSLQWSEDYRGVGGFELHCPDDPEIVAMLRQGHYLYKSGKRSAMVIRYVRPDSEEMSIVARGFTTLDLLSQRVVFPALTVGNIEQGMYAIVHDNACVGGFRAIESIAVSDTPEGYDAVHETQFLGEELPEALSTLGEAGDLGYYMTFDHKAKRHVFTVYQGLDRTHGQFDNPPVVFAAEYGNLRQVIITDDMSLFKNTAIVGGEIDEENPRVFVVAGAAEGLDRHETFVDASSIRSEDRDEENNKVELTPEEYEERLLAHGHEALGERIHAESFEGKIDVADWGVKYCLGDKVTCISSRYKVRLDVRITHYQEIIENNVTQISVTLGEPQIIPMRGRGLFGAKVT